MDASLVQPPGQPPLHAVMSFDDEAAHGADAAMVAHGVELLRALAGPANMATLLAHLTGTEATTKPAAVRNAE